MYAFVVRAVLYPLVALMRLALLPCALIFGAAAFGAYLSGDLLGCFVCAVLCGASVETRRLLAIA